MVLKSKCFFVAKVVAFLILKSFKLLLSKHLNNKFASITIRQILYYDYHIHCGIVRTGGFAGDFKPLLKGGECGDEIDI